MCTCLCSTARPGQTETAPTSPALSDKISRAASCTWSVLMSNVSWMDAKSLPSCAYSSWGAGAGAIRGLKGAPCTAAGPEAALKFTCAGLRSGLRLWSGHVRQLAEYVR